VLDHHEQYYKLEAERLVASSSTPEYLRRAELRLNEEADRVTSCLSTEWGSAASPASPKDASVKPTSIRSTVEQELIGKQMETLLVKEGSGIVRLLEV
jgi:cullin 3